MLRSLSEMVGKFGTRGYVEAYDAETESDWRFTVPGNPADGFEIRPWKWLQKLHGRWWKHFGGGTVWNALTYDPKLDLLFVGVEMAILGSRC